MNYKEYKFIDASALIAEIKEEMRSYFESGGVTDIMIPTYIDQCLRKLRLSTLKPESAVLYFKDYVSYLPDDFHLLDYAIAYDTDYITSGTIPSTIGYWYKSIECIGNCDATGLDSCDPKYEIFERITCPSTAGYKFKLSQPKWIRVYTGSAPFCLDNCPNFRSSSTDVINIMENKRVMSTFTNGCVYIRYFSRPINEEGIPMIPEILEVELYIKSYVKFKLFEQLWHSVVDESSKQIESKLSFYQRQYMNDLAAAISVLLSHTKQQEADSIAKRRTRYIKYHIN